MTAQPRTNAGVPRDRNGFTLLELVITIAVAGLLLAIAVPSSRTWRANANSGQSARTLVNTLMEARSKAIASNYQCKVDFDVPNGRYRMQTGSQAYNTPNSSSKWTTVPSYDYASVSSDVTMKGASDCSSTATIDVQFNANGTAKLESPVGTQVPGPVVVCLQGSSGTSTKKISIAASGRVSLD
jgi:prepilin-type N-terminal cleavage/methylation domain-containing protein